MTWVERLTDIHLGLSFTSNPNLADPYNFSSKRSKENTIPYLPPIIPNILLQETLQFQINALTVILSTAIALPLPDSMGHFSFKRQIPADITGAIAGSLSGITGASTGAEAGILGAVTGAVASLTGLGLGVPI